MDIGGIQKLTLLDYPDKTACTVFTGGCNFRCPFCHNASLVIGAGDNFGENELFELLKKRRGILDGVCVTGGEPLIHPDVGKLIEKIKKLGFLVKLDTNGSYPEQLKDLAESGNVDYVAMDIKNSREKYGETIGVKNYDTAAVEESVSFLLSGKTEYEFRTTVVKGLHEKEDMIAIGEWIKGAGKYYLQQFVDSGDLIGKGCEAYPKETMEEFLGLVRPYVGLAGLRGI